MNYLILAAVLVVGIAQVHAGLRPLCPARDGSQTLYFADSDVTKFWVCSNGVPYLLTCPAGLNFNEQKSVCDWSFNGNNDNDSSGDSDSSDQSDSSSGSSSESESQEDDDILKLQKN